MKRIRVEEYLTLFPDSRMNPDDHSEVFLPEKEDLALPRRDRNTHKYSYGRALVVAGSVGFSGAPVLAANACEKSGAGLTTLMVPQDIYPIAAARCDGAVVTPLLSVAGCAAPEAMEIILPALKRANACAVGPGFGTGDGSSEILSGMLKEAECPLVLDADAITILGKRPELFSLCRSRLILTPHEGEFRRIGGKTDQGRLNGALRRKNRFRESHR